ncbi:hypothetical protein BDQ17DRAFT_1351989 [Cyathus striatus]|nr:hypothetical protein BDQ17DRAFT_1351989 [Cyathus striatus]
MSLELFNESVILKYLDLPHDYQPSPKTDAVVFLKKHLTQLPPHILLHFSHITTPKQRSVLPTIRNRRLTYTVNNPPELHFLAARRNWPLLWEGRERRGIEEGREEKAWAEIHVGKLGNLLKEYEEEREAERIRIMRRENAALDDFVPEEDESSSDEDEDIKQTSEQETEEEIRTTFERLIRERFIYGLLDNIDYDKVDWDETLDDAEDNREAEERWFDEDEDE